MSEDDAKARDRRAQAADRLLKDPLLVKAFETVSRNAMMALVGADAGNPHEIIRYQAKAQVCDEVISELEGAILAALPQEGPPAP